MVDGVRTLPACVSDAQPEPAGDIGWFTSPITGNTFTVTSAGKAAARAGAYVVRSRGTICRRRWVAWDDPGLRASGRSAGMKVRALAAAAAITILAPLGAMAGAAGASPTMSATPGSYITRTGFGSANLSASYACEDGNHLWVSAKQAAGGRYDARLTQEGSSQISAAWLQSHPANFTCDGARRTQTFPINTDEQGFGTLVRGLAYVQFCLVSPEGELLISETRWVAVI
jgi:hypothetical protein